MRKIWIGGMVLLVVSMLNIFAYADAPVVGLGKKVTLDYTLIVDNKEVETSTGKAPLNFIVGRHNIISGLESQLNGLRVNEEKIIKVAPKDAYGEMDPKEFKEIPKTSLPKGMDLKVGLFLEATAPDGSQFPAVISELKGDKVVLNFNHPLAGKELTFKVKVLKIEDVPAPADAPALQKK